MVSRDSLNQKDLVRQQFELISANIKSIFTKRRDKMTAYERDFIFNAIKKVVFIKNSFDTKSFAFNQIMKGIGIQSYPKNAIIFQKGDEGNHFYIVVEGVCCVEVENIKQGKKQKQIYYYPGDSFGEVSLIYDVPRGTRIVADQQSTLITIKKQTFNQCGDLRKNILKLNKFFENHPFFQVRISHNLKNQQNFMIRVVSSMSRLCKFGQDQVIIEQGNIFNEILFFMKGQAKVFRTLHLQNENGQFTQTIEIQNLVQDSVYGEHFYTNKIPSTIRIIGITRGQFIRVSFKDDVHTIQNALYKRIRHNSLRFPTDQQLFGQFKFYLDKKLRQLQYICTIYKENKQKKQQLTAIKRKMLKIKHSRLAQK